MKTRLDVFAALLSASGLIILGGCAATAQDQGTQRITADCRGPEMGITVSVTFDENNCPTYPGAVGDSGCSRFENLPGDLVNPVCLCARQGEGADRLAWQRDGDGPELGVFFSPFGPAHGSPSGGNSGRLRSSRGKIVAMSVGPVAGRAERAIIYKYTLVSLEQGNTCDPIDPPVIIEQ